MGHWHHLEAMFVIRRLRQKEILKNERHKVWRRTNGCGSWLLAVSPFLSIGGFALIKLQNSPGFFSQACQSSLESNVAVMHPLVFVSPLPFSVLATMTEPRQLMLLFDFSVESSGLSLKKGGKVSVRLAKITKWKCQMVLINSRANDCFWGSKLLAYQPSHSVVEVTFNRYANKPSSGKGNKLLSLRRNCGRTNIFSVVLVFWNRDGLDANLDLEKDVE